MGGQGGSAFGSASGELYELLFSYDISESAIRLLFSAGFPCGCVYEAGLAEGEMRKALHSISGYRWQRQVCTPMMKAAAGPARPHSRGDLVEELLQRNWTNQRLLCSKPLLWI